MSAKTLSVVLVNLLLSTIALADLKAKSSKTFSGDEGVSVTIVRIEGDERKALLKVSGTDSDLDKQPLMAGIRDGGNGKEDYFVDLKTGRSNVIVKRDGYELYIPGKGKKYHIWYDKDESKKANADEIVKAYQAATK